MTLKLLAVLGLTVAAMPVGAQDLYVPPSTAEYGDALLHSRLTGRMIRQAQERRAGASPASTKAKAQATCRNREQIASRLSAAKARHLYSLCARAGY